MMSKYDIISKIAKEKIVENIARHYNVSSPYVKDLCQDVYIELLCKGESLIVGLYERNEIGYYIRKIISNNINSTTSPYYKNYEKFRKSTDEIKNEKTED